MRAVIFTNKELDLGGFGLKEVYLIFAKGVKGSITVSEMSETVELAQSKMPLIKKAEEIIEKLEKSYEVLGMSVIFKDYEEEIESVLEAYKPDVLIAGRYMPLNQKILDQEAAILFHREKVDFEKLLYIHSVGGNIEKARKWIRMGKEIMIYGLIEPMLPPETHARKMKESQEKIQREIDQISEDLSVKKSILVGNFAEEVERLVSELNPSILLLNKKVGIDKIEDLLEKIDRSVLVI
ncbi:MAG: hypothetical protein NZ879_03865 [Archaeoglobaceae archaeon]|nr:hypothetical protein [Archaeoglobaceae archaeon]MDW8118101.1 hypothetical protein [Archaeoglobaceae archaeon]